jgi:hypothetical protein
MSLCGKQQPQLGCLGPFSPHHGPQLQVSADIYHGNEQSCFSYGEEIFLSTCVSIKIEKKNINQGDCFQEKWRKHIS